MVLLTSLAIVAAAISVGVIAAPFAAPVLLGIIGFGIAGPIAGTIAAGIQAGIGNVAAGSLFAIAQSIAMGGAIPAFLSAISGLLTGAAAAIAILI